ncbi:mitochondrial inner membrane protein OXA1L isoform X2 [Thrips palmi]|nr:mitochondrial inner membrane protein OXA1L isoform X2 [Thrips palmi]XP_034232402.1 mitochondrial inner membrane protein OXA1L isoform X2 [Thrips palmi]XP_034232403.1 mitochondrial inner membrane protein OXA1L isoform X2 [Thrips palmi]
MFRKHLPVLQRRVRFTSGAFQKGKITQNVSQAIVPVHQPLLQPHPSFCIVRHASTNSVVPPIIAKAIEASSPQSSDALQSSNIQSLIETIGPIPEAPNLPGPKVLELLSNGEPSLSSLGLGGYYPTGILQQLLELVHVSADLPWGWTIVSVAAAIRILCFKLVVRQRQESAKMVSVMPQLTFLQQKVLEARQQNDMFQAAKYARELSSFQENMPSLFSSLKYGVAQGAILISFTQALRQMCNLPVESLQTGGFSFMMDLTLRDPTYILPLINGLLFYLHLAFGKEMHALFPGKSPWLIQLGMGGVSAGLFLLSINFQGAIVLYWISSQVVTVVQHRILSMPKVKKYYKLEVSGSPTVAAMLKKEADKKKSGVQNLGFYARFKEGRANNRIAEEVRRRTELDSAAFERAGREPIRKTYKYDITKQKNK